MQPEDDIRRKLTEKFINYESEPQEESWDKIRTSIQLSQMFQNYETDPQDNSWEKIRAGIDLPQRMKEFESEPQEESWEKIRAGVDLAQKFKDYETEPQVISWLKIQEAIQPKKRRRGIIIPLFYRVGIAAGIVLLLGSLWWLITKPEGPELTAGITKSKKVATPIVKPSAGKTPEKLNTKNSDSIDKPLNKPAQLVENEGIAATSGAKKDVYGKELSPAFKKRTEVHTRIQKDSQKTRLAKNKAKRELKKGSGVIPLIQEKDKNSTETLAGVSLDTKTLESSPLQLAELSGKNFQQKPIRKLFGAITYNTEKPFQEKAQRVHRDMVFTTSLMPLQTYQAFTILPQTNTYIQQVGRLDAIDNQRLGIQLRAGAMKPLSNRFAIGVSASYTGLQQWANYELNSGEYEVQTADNGSYTLVGIGEQVSQKQFLQTLGLKLDNAYLVSRKKTKIYAIGGAEAVHVLNNKDFGYYVNASIGLSYPIKGGKSIWIEPTFRYGLSQSFDANNYLKIRPYNIGLNIRVNFI